MLSRRLDVECDPLLAVERVGADKDGVMLLHSGRCAYGLGRYSVLVANPVLAFDYREGRAVVSDEDGERVVEGELFDVLGKAFSRFETKRAKGRFPFCGGMVGYFGYEVGRGLERVSERGRDTGGYDARFRFYTGGIVFDHQTREVYATSCLDAFDARMEGLIGAVVDTDAVQYERFQLEGVLVSNFSKDAYVESVGKVRELIREGEVYQVNLSQRYAGRYAGSPWALYRKLEKRSAAPYAAYLSFGDEWIVSSSPERFLEVRDGVATTRPIKGTRPIGGSEAETEVNEAALRDSEKDRSELLMIVDLERNDLGRVCQPGSVVVDELFALERYATVIHQTANVSGKVREGLGALDVVKAMFPGGSITGAPKIRSMQVIDALEGVDRGVYTGAIGYVDFSGEADFNIAIRTIRCGREEVSFHVGGGIVWDSDPESEYEETLVKAKAMMDALTSDE